MTVIGVLGQGAVGRAIAGRLGECGLPVRAADRRDRESVLTAAPPVLILATTRGEQAQEQLEELRYVPRVVLDVTTQSPTSIRRCAEAAAALGAAYHGGGLTGGAGELAAGDGVLLLGAPVDRDGPAGPVVAALGRTIDFPTPEAAATAKLLHNWVLVAQQWAAGLAVRAVGPVGLPALVEVLSSGTAGRPVGQWSVIRDALDTPRSTYLARLVEKDLGEIAEALPELRVAAGPLLTRLRTTLAGSPDEPYTKALLTDLGGVADQPGAADQPKEAE